MSDHDSIERLDVLVIGAGLSGIGAASFIAQRCPWATYAILEARSVIGGTWDLFRYPGIRSDSDMYTLGYSFRPWSGEKAIADGPSILSYIRETAATTGVDRAVRYQKRAIAAAWSTPEARWLVTIEDTETGARSEVSCSFLFSCTGYYRYDHGYEPHFEGIEEFQGTVVHPQAWPEDLEVAGKEIVVIGSGATAVTLVPSLAQRGAHVTMLQRSPTYVSSMPAKDVVATSIQRVLPARIAGPIIRWFKALSTQAFYELSRRRPATVKKMIRRQLEKALPEGYDIDTNFTPRYNPWDQRFCLVPDGDLFNAISDGSAEVVTDTIARIAEHAVQLDSGNQLDADVIVTATGLELLFLGGIELSVDGAPCPPADRLSYKGMMLESVPNLAFAIGYTNASWTLKCDLTCDTVCRILNHMHETGLRQATPTNRSAHAIGSVFDLSSGYVQRSKDQLPKQGSAFPWQVYQSYVRDYMAMRLSKIEDDAMVFSNPAPAPAVVA